MSKSFYDALGVPPSASEDEIKAAYRRLAKAHHPDLTRNRSTNERRLSDEEIRLLNEAYSVLMKQERRELYDRCRETGADFREVEMGARPETEAEREVREATEAHYQQAVKACLEDVLVAVQSLGGTWRREPPEDDYFDAFLVGNRGPSRSKVSVKIFPELGPNDVPGIAEYAEALLQMAPKGLIREQHAYLLLGRTVKDARVLRGRLELFNQRVWTTARPRAPRAFLAFSGVQEGVVMAPGAQAPDPPLPSVRLRLMKHFRF